MSSIVEAAEKDSFGHRREKNGAVFPRHFPFRHLVSRPGGLPNDRPAIIPVVQVLFEGAGQKLARNIDLQKMRAGVDELVAGHVGHPQR